MSTAAIEIKGGERWPSVERAYDAMRDDPSTALWSEERNEASD
jgi:hypothetical protein